MHHINMLPFYTVAFVGLISAAQSVPSQPASSMTRPPATAASIAHLPTGKTTVMGGEIRNVDPVRDRFTLKVFGGHPVKILFDERTQIFKNGKKVPVLDLHADDHASVQTILDGDSIFAVRINMLSSPPDDDFRGKVSSYNPQSNQLTMVTSAGQQPLTVDVPSGTPVFNVGQDGTATPEQGSVSFARGSLVDVTLTGGHGKNGLATRVNILAVPGSSFEFAGSVSALDVHAGKLVVLDPRDNQSYPIAFGPSLEPLARKLHLGSPVKVQTTFDGERYKANEITPE
jgi:hypothetical protein